VGSKRGHPAPEQTRFSARLLLTGRELDLAATTDAADVRAFMAGDGPRLVFGTYQSYEVLVDAGARFGLTVADEAHHLAGDPEKAYAGARRGQVPSARTLYMTATPKRFRRRRSGDDLGSRAPRRIGTENRSKHG
jgi:predicted helicase